MSKLIIYKNLRNLLEIVYIIFVAIFQKKKQLLLHHFNFHNVHDYEFFCYTFSPRFSFMKLPAVWLDL